LSSVVSSRFWGVWMSVWLTDEVIGAAEELKRGLMQRLLTQGIGHTEYKQTPLGKIPKTWKITEIGRVAKRVKSGNKRSVKTSNYIGIEHIESNTGEIIGFDEEEKYTTKQTFKKGHILYGRIRSYLNKSWHATDDGYCSTDIIVITPTKIKGEILNQILLSKKFVNYSIRYSYGSQLPRVHWKDISKYPIALPPNEEQQEIVDIIKNIKEKIKLDKEEVIQLKLVKSGLMQDLLSGRVRVELREDGLHRVADNRETHN